jgi:hypothetical protein
VAECASRENIPKGCGSQDWAATFRATLVTLGNTVRNPKEKTMAEIVWTVKDLSEALKRFPPDAKVYYEMGPNGAGTIGRAQYVRARGDDDDMGVLLDR